MASGSIKCSEINYQGISKEQIKKNFRGEVIYNAETETHFPHLTVGETLKFAALARTPKNRLPGVTREQHAEHLRDVMMASFGLLHTVNTKVGDDYVRGISGGERKRVSIVEVCLSGAPLRAGTTLPEVLTLLLLWSLLRTLRSLLRLASRLSLCRFIRLPRMPMTSLTRSLCSMKAVRSTLVLPKLLRSSLRTWATSVPNAKLPVISSLH